MKGKSGCGEKVNEGDKRMKVKSGWRRNSKSRQKGEIAQRGERVTKVSCDHKSLVTECFSETHYYY